MYVQSFGQQARADHCLPPAVQRMVERFHRQLKAALRARCSGADWLEHLPWVLLGLRAAPKDEAGVSAAEATYGHSLVLPSQLQQPPLAPQAPPKKVDTIRVAKENEKKKEVGIQEASHVYMWEEAVIGPLDATYCGPYRVLVREPKKLLLETGATRTWVSVDRLKPHTGAAAPTSAQPPPRGRPEKKV